MKALDVKKGYIGIEVNKLDAIEAIEKEVKKIPKDKVRHIVEDRLLKIANGERDFRF